MKTFNLGVLALFGAFLALQGCEAPAGGNGSLNSAQQLTIGEPGICGQVQSTTLFGGQHIDTGSVQVSNDEEFLYVAYHTTGEWLLTETHLAVASSLSGIPQKNGNPIPGKFPLKRIYDPAVDHDVYKIPLADLDGDSVFIAAHAVVVKFVDGQIVASETGWGYGPGFPGKNWATYFNYTIQPCLPPPPPGDLEFRTQTQGGWGTSASGNNPGTYRDANFPVCFPEGIAIGCEAGNTALFTSSAAVQAFLPQGGTAGYLGESLVDPVTSGAGVLAGQALALSLSVGFDYCDQDFGASPSLLADLVVADEQSPCFGLTVAQVLYQGNMALGGCDADFDFSTINDCLSSINENFVDGTTDNGFLALQ